MSGILTAFITSTACILVYIAFFCLRRKTPQFESGVRKLIYHGKAMGFIWLVMSPVFFLVLSRFNMTGLYLLSSETSAADIAAVIHGVIVLSICFFFYMAAYYLVDRSVSSRMMIEIEKSPQKRLKFDQLKSNYDIDKKYRGELDGMLQGGFLYIDGKRYRCTWKGRMLVRIAVVIKKYLKLGPGG